MKVSIRILAPAAMRGLFTLLVLFSLLSVAPSRAEEVELTLPDGKVALGEYRPGKADLPAILILHGFLQTRDFPTVKRLADSLNEEFDYPVLTPTLTLGISRRKSSLACEAIQNHNLEGAVAEIHAWVEWLKKKGHHSIVLVGHSTGSIMLTAYLQKADAEVIHALLISLTHFGPVHSVFHGESGDPVERARRLSKGAGKDLLAEFPIAYCKTYVATPENVLSYYNWDESHVLAALDHAKIPVTVIIGSEDARMEAEWLAALRARNQVDIKIIEGADHFFDSEHEFSLLETVDELLQKISTQ